MLLPPAPSRPTNDIIEGVSDGTPYRLLGLESDSTSTQLSCLDLRESLMIRDGSKQIINLDDWPILIFLKGFGCSKIEFRTRDINLIDAWSARILSYEQSYLSDPDSVKVDECHWDEVDPHSGIALIQCFFERIESFRANQMAQPAVPLMEGPIGVPSSAALNFMRELETESPIDTLHRFTLILNEYRSYGLIKDSKTWSLLIGDVMAVCLEYGQINKAKQIAEEHREALSAYWTDVQRTSRLLASYDPKVFELNHWMKIFETIPSSRLIGMLESLLTTPAGPQTLKLISARTHENPDEMIEICFHSDSAIQKLLLQWLLPHWRPAHFEKILNNLHQSKKRKDGPEIQRLWILALVRSSSRNAYDELYEFFKPKLLIWGSSHPQKKLQKLILQTLGENPNSETREFMKRILKFLKGDLAQYAEQIIQGQGRIGG